MTEVDAFWDAALACAQNEDRSEGGPLRDAVSKATSNLANVGHDLTVYVAKTTPASYRNQVWQGGGNSRRNDAMVLIDSSSNEKGVSSEAKARLNPTTKNGFDAVVICGPAGGGYQVQSVVEYPGGTLGLKLEAALGKKIDCRFVADPAVAASLAPAFPESEDTDEEERIAVDALVAHLIEAKNVVLAGPPGTSKTHLALEAVSRLAGSNVEDCRLERILSGRDVTAVPTSQIVSPPVVWEMVQFHPSYGYEEFVRGLRTDPNAKGFTLKSFDGILPIMAQVATARGEKPTVLIIDEINRSNLSLALGEAIFAIDPDHRGRAVRLQYPSSDGGGDALIVPPALYLLATMNTADRSIAMMDFAVRRRFRVLAMGPSRSVLEEYYQSHAARADVAWSILASINASIGNYDYHVGHSYVLSAADKTSEEWAYALACKLVQEVRPLLEEYREENLTSSVILLQDGDSSVDLMTCPIPVLATAVQGRIAAHG